MGTPEEKTRHRNRRRSHVARDLRTIKYRQRVREDKKRLLETEEMTYSDLVRLINSETEMEGDD